MTEHSEHLDPEEGRAAEAFRAALSRHAAEVAPDVALPTRPSPRRGRWVAGAAALAVAASAVAGFAVMDRDRPGDGALDPAGEPPVVAEGWRGATFRDVTVQVPEDWGDASAPGPDWCADVPREPIDGPYVDLRGNGGFVFSIGCFDQESVPPGFGPDPEDQWIPHVRLVDLTQDDLERIPDGMTTHEGWTLRARTLGDVQVRLLTDASTEDVAEAIVASAQQSGLGALGCDTTSPAQEQPREDRPVVPSEGSLSAVDPGNVRGLLVCQYDRVGPDGPGLRAERLGDVDAARSWLSAVLGAPRTGGPDQPENCSEPWESGMTLVVHPLGPDGERLATAYVAYDACAGNGVRDGETTWELTRDTCAALFGERVVFWSGNGEAAKRCMPEQR